MHFLLRYLGTAAAVFLTIHFVPGVNAEGGWLTILLVALAWSVITMFVRPTLALLTLPITIVTLGLFSLVLNALLFWLMEAVVPGFTVDGFFPALLGAIVLSILSWLIHSVFKPRPSI